MSLIFSGRKLKKVTAQDAEWAHYLFRKQSLILVIGFVVLLAGCCDCSTIWSSKVKSPDGLWLASAKTVESGGPGNAAVGTSVYMNYADNGKRGLILHFNYPSAYPQGITNVKLHWLTPKHLEVIYQKSATIRFQAIKFGDVRISVKSQKSITRINRRIKGTQPELSPRI